MCPDGRNCTRGDAQHFVQLSHPRVPCPMCGREFEVSSPLPWWRWPAPWQRQPPRRINPKTPYYITIITGSPNKRTCEPLPYLRPPHGCASPLPRKRAMSCMYKCCGRWRCVDTHTWRCTANKVRPDRVQHRCPACSWSLHSTLAYEVFLLLCARVTCSIHNEKKCGMKSVRVLEQE